MANDALTSFETRDYTVSIKSDIDELMKNHYENVLLLTNHMITNTIITYIVYLLFIENSKKNIMCFRTIIRNKYS